MKEEKGAERDRAKKVASMVDAIHEEQPDLRRGTDMAQGSTGVENVALLREGAAC